MKLSNSLYCRITALLVLALVVFAQIRAPAGQGVAPSELLIPSFFYPAAWSVTIFLLIVTSSRERLLLATLIAACMTAGAVATLLVGETRLAVRVCFITAGLAPYFLMVRHIVVNTGPERSRWIDALAIASLIHVSALGNNFFRDETAVWIPKIVDPKIAEFEEGFGFQFSAVMAYVLAAVPPLDRLAWAAYNFVQIPIIVVAAFQWRRKGADGFSILPGFIFGSMIGYTCYWLTPAIGPKAYFGADFPLLHATPAYLAHLPLFDFDPHHDRNAMPSMHISWAVLIYLYSRSFPLWARCCAGLFVVLTACATMGFGEHYFMDLVVAAPLVLLVRALFAMGLDWTNAARSRAAVSGLAMLAFWIMAILIEANLTSSLVVALTGITLAASIFLERALAREEARADTKAVAKGEAPVVAADPAPILA
jgi:hypothetical protein